jgi:acyl-CoA synthetase (AMP-forming)/AMP-acid ligase II
LKISDRNTLMIRSCGVAKRYLGAGELPVDPRGYLDTGDLVELRDDRYHFRGRLNGAINVGGNKVQPETIESVLNRMEGISMAKVSAMKSPIMGNLVRAAVVTGKPMDLAQKKTFARRIRQYCGNHLEKFMVPAIIDFVDDIEINSTGKTAR